MSGRQNRAISPASFYGPRPSEGLSRQAPAPQLPDTPPRHKAVATLNPQATPVFHKLNASAIYTSMHFERNQEMLQLGWEMEGKFVGPMPVAEFLKTFLPRATAGNLPVPPLPWTSDSRAAFKRATDQICEVDMYIPLVRLRGAMERTTLTMMCFFTDRSLTTVLPGS
jgi:hypothetical protein